MNTVAENIKRLRKNNNMTQDELAEKMCVTRQAVSNWETEKNQPDIETLVALADFFGTDVNEIICGNKTDNYQRYQRKHIKSVIICAVILLLLILVRIFLLPYLKEIQSKTYTLGAEVMLISIISAAGIYFTLGFTAISIFSLLSDCSVKKSKPLLLFSLIALIPLFIILAEYLSLTFISENTPMYVLKACMINPWLYTLLIRIMPCLSGILNCIYRNSKNVKFNNAVK